MAAYSRADLNEMIDAYGGRGALVRALGYSRGAAGSQERRDYNAAMRSIQRATAPASAKERHASVTTQSKLGANITAKVDPKWVKVNAAYNRAKQRLGHAPQQVTVQGEFRVSNDKRHRAVNFPLDDGDALAALLGGEVDEFATEEMGQETEIDLDDLDFS